jgi:hypothetical protein
VESRNTDPKGRIAEQGLVQTDAEPEKSERFEVFETNPPPTEAEADSALVMPDQTTPPIEQVAQSPPVMEDASPDEQPPGADQQDGNDTPAKPKEKRRKPASETGRPTNEAALPALERSGLPFPYAELGLDKSKQIGIERAITSGEMQIKNLPKTRDPAAAAQRIRDRVAKQIDGLLTAEQRRLVAEYTKNGVPIGAGCFRTSAIQVTAQTQATGGGGEVISARALAGRVQAAMFAPQLWVVRVRFSAINRSGENRPRTVLVETGGDYGHEFRNEKRIADWRNGESKEIDVTVMVKSVGQPYTAKLSVQ